MATLPPSTDRAIVDEHGLDQFRRRHLSPAALLELIEWFVRVLVRLSVGIGKSSAVDGLLAHPATHEHFDLVLYVAPSWDVIHERAIVSGAAESPVPFTLIRPRPSETCGAYADEWAIFERRGCGALAKKLLCGPCRATVDANAACFFPEQLRKQTLAGVRLIFLTEAQLVLNRALVPLLRQRTGARRVLVILDEAQMLDKDFEVVVSAPEVARFESAVRGALHAKGGAARLAADQFEQFLQALRSAAIGDLELPSVQFPVELSRHAAVIQERGIDLHGDRFRYLGWDLNQLVYSQRHERWKDGDGSIRFIARPWVRCHLLILSAHLTSVYAAHRLGVDSIASPFEQTKFRHSESRVVNLMNRSGAAWRFPKTREQILDQFAAILLRNIAEGRTSIFVSKKKFKVACAGYLKARLAGWGVDVHFVVDAYDDLPAVPDPRVVPILNYGILGVNSFEAYDGAYCLNSYYVASSDLNRRLQEAEAARFRVEVKIVSGPTMARHVELVDRGTPDLDHTYLGNVYLRKLEVDPVIQAVGRVRPLTRPREVVVFQMADVRAELPGCIEVRSLRALRGVLGVPSAREIDHLRQGLRIRALMSGEGLTAEEAAARIGVSRRTAFDRLRAIESAGFPLKEILVKGENLHSARGPGAAAEVGP